MSARNIHGLTHRRPGRPHHPLMGTHRQPQADPHQPSDGQARRVRVRCLCGKPRPRGSQDSTVRGPGSGFPRKMGRCLRKPTHLPWHGPSGSQWCLDSGSCWALKGSRVPLRHRLRGSHDRHQTSDCDLFPSPTLQVSPSPHPQSPCSRPPRRSSMPTRPPWCVSSATSTRVA